MQALVDARLSMRQLCLWVHMFILVVDIVLCYFIIVANFEIEILIVIPVIH